MTTLMIATPAYSGQVNIPYALSFANTLCELQKHNIKVIPLIVTSGSLLVAERNRILEAFWQSEATHLLCIDSDLGWPAQAVLAMLEQNKEFVAGCYPARGKSNSFLFRPALNANGSIVQEKHLLKMTHIPAGFMLLSRGGIKKMRDHFPELWYSPKDKRDDTESTFCLFNTEVYDGEFWGEDYVFCRRAREAGLEIWVDPLIQFDHAGTIGMLMECLTQDPNKPPVPAQNWNNQVANPIQNYANNRLPPPPGEKRPAVVPFKSKLIG
jgi:hypothetical protein